MNEPNQNRAIRPLGDVVHCRMLEQVEKRTPGGLFIPDTEHRRPHRAVVLAVGPGIRPPKSHEHVPIGLKRGDVVIVNPHKLERVLADGAMAQAAGSPYARGGEEFFVRASDVHAVLEDYTPSFVEVETALETLDEAFTAHALNESFEASMQKSLAVLREALAVSYGQAQKGGES